MNSLDDVSKLITLLGLVILIGLCVALAVIIAVTAIALVIYVLVECLLRPFLGRCLDIDMEIGQRGQRARMVTYHAVVPTDLRMPSGIFDAQDLHDHEPQAKRGLTQNAIEIRLPRLLVRHCDERSMACGECAICLSEYTVDEECRVFPVCRHMYHAHCIDPWLQNHLSCPTCRKELFDW